MPRSPHMAQSQGWKSPRRCSPLLPRLYERTVVELQLEAVVLHVFDIHLEHHLRRLAEQAFFEAFQTVPCRRLSPLSLGPGTARSVSPPPERNAAGSASPSPPLVGEQVQPAPDAPNSSRMALMSGFLMRLVDHSWLPCARSPSGASLFVATRVIRHARKFASRRAGAEKLRLGDFGRPTHKTCALSPCFSGCTVLPYGNKAAINAAHGFCFRARCDSSLSGNPAVGETPSEPESATLQAP